MRAGIVYKSGEVLSEVLSFLKSKGVECFAFEKPTDELEDFDFIVSIGGDGTVLRILQEVKKCPPIFGINLGRIGLLTHSSPSDFKEKLEIAMRNFEVEEFMRLNCRIGDDELLALNEIAVFNVEVAKLVTIGIEVDGVEIDRIRCDGLIVATQIGSTGYAFSSGGPVVDPYLESIIVTPVAPFRFGWKPWVFKSNRVIRVDVDKEVYVIADGQKRIKTSGRITIAKSRYPAVFFKKNRIEELAKKVKRIE